MKLENNGERMDINYYNMNYDNFDIYQKSHYKRYEKAKELVKENYIVGDMACGSGYGSMMLSEKCKEVHGVDIDSITIDEIKKRYKNEKKIFFYNMNLLDIDFENKFDLIVSFETIEHFNENDIIKLMSFFYRSLKPTGKLFFSTPYNQEKNILSMKWHQSFYMTEDKIKNLIQKFFNIKNTYYQNYNSHIIEKELELKHFIICEAEKIII